MDNFNDEVFEFGEKQNDTAENFNYENISGLGESNYENEDLFDNMPPVNQTVEQPINNVNIPTFETQQIDVNIPSFYNNTESNQNNDYSNIFDLNSGDFVDNNYNEIPVEPVSPQTVEPVNSEVTVPVESTDTQPLIEPQQEVKPTIEPLEMPIISPVEQQAFPTIEPLDTPVVEQHDAFEKLPTIENDSLEESEQVEDNSNNMYSAPDASPDIPMSTTPIDELQKLTEYEEEEIDTTDINSLFDKISVNVKDASEIFKKNTSLKQKIDTRFEELKSLQSELTNSRKKQMEEIDKYKDEVLQKLTEKKEEIEKRLNTLKELQATLEKEKTEFEEYKRTEQANISKIQKQVQSAYDDRREELEKIEDVLRKQKDSLDEERNQLSLDKIQYEADKNDLANNLIKFNQIVNSFTNGLDINKEE